MEAVGASAMRTARVQQWNAGMWSISIRIAPCRIIAMARLGELDCDRLREGALRYLAEMKETAHPTQG